jgi:capsular polysaccharide transport system permease protein
MTVIRGEAEYVLGLSDLLRAQARVIVALMLRDLKTRFFGSEFGYLIAVAWPLAHILLLVTIHSHIGRIAPYGDSSVLWFATGVVPFLAFSYVSRFTMIGLVLNKPLLAFPKVKVLDIIFARAFLEILNAGLVILFLIAIFTVLNINWMPRDPVQALFALCACISMGLGAGIINAIIAAAAPMWTRTYLLFIVILYLSSGVYFVPHALPEPLPYLLSFHPLAQGVEWMRSAYYDGYGTAFIDKPYMLGWAAALIFIGLSLERLVRGRLMLR